MKLAFKVASLKFLHKTDVTQIIDLNFISLKQRLRPLGYSAHHES